MSQPTVFPYYLARLLLLLLLALAFITMGTPEAHAQTETPTPTPTATTPPSGALPANQPFSPTASAAPTIPNWSSPAATLSTGAVVVLEGYGALATTTVSPNLLRAILLAGTPPRSYTVTVINPDAQAASLPNALTVTAPPGLTSTPEPTHTPAPTALVGRYWWSIVTGPVQPKSPLAPTWISR
ncbi:MAG: hypothetical protein M5U34_23100 [Chloroflexi bacterium]|nr:hypothetical protein [Chloroflexota bacterium]